MFGLKLTIIGDVHPLEFVGSGSGTQLWVGENLNIFNLELFKRVNYYDYDYLYVGLY